jgi:hypothetical protein
VGVVSRAAAHPARDRVAFGETIVAGLGDRPRDRAAGVELPAEQFAAGDVEVVGDVMPLITRRAGDS